MSAKKQGEIPRVASTWKRKDQAFPWEVVMVTGITWDKDHLPVVGFAAIDNPGMLQQKHALSFFLELFEPVPVGADRREAVAKGSARRKAVAR